MAGAWEQADRWGGAVGLLGLLPCVAPEVDVERTVEAMVSLMDSRGVIIIQGAGGRVLEQPSGSHAPLRSRL